MEFSPKKIYEGYNAIFRNIIPSVIILFPIIICLRDVELIKNYFIVFILLLYLFVSAIIHMIYETVGYIYLSKNLPIKKEVQDSPESLLNRIKNLISFIKNLIKCFKECIIRLPKCIIIPSFHQYVTELVIKINKSLSDTYRIHFNEYREIQNSYLYRLYYGDHEVFHRLNSILICYDHAVYGFYVCLLTIGIERFLLSISVINVLYSNIINMRVYLIIMVSLTISFVMLRCLIKNSIVKIETYYFLEHFGIGTAEMLIDNFREKRNG